MHWILTVSTSSAHPVSYNIKPTPGYSIKAESRIKSLLALAGFLFLEVLALAPRINLHLTISTMIIGELST